MTRRALLLALAAIPALVTGAAAALVTHYPRDLDGTASAMLAAVTGGAGVASGVAGWRELSPAKGRPRPPNLER